MEALEYYENSLCGGCGQSLLLTTDDDFDGYFHVEPAPSCLSCQASGMWGKTAQAKNISPGQRFNTNFKFTPEVQRG